VKERLLETAPPKLVTVVGAVEYAQLREPDQFGDYSVRVRVPAHEARELLKLIDEEIAAVCAECAADVKRAPLPYTTEDGAVIVRAKLKGKVWNGTYLAQQRPRILDAQGKPLPNTLNIGVGSQVKARAELVPFYMKKAGVGCSLRLHAVKVLKLVEWKADAAYYGFTASR
jgi:hypothetical protein